MLEIVIGDIEEKPEVEVDDLPDNIFTVYVNDFGDNYHKEEDTSIDEMTDLEKRVRKIRRRYRDMMAWTEACHDYDEWMEYLENKHGGNKLLKFKIQNNMIPDYIPPKPRIKETKTIKACIEQGIILSSVPKGRVIDVEHIMETYHEVYGYESEIVHNKKTDKEVKKIRKESIEEHVKSPSYKKSKARRSDVDFLDEYFSIKNSKYKKGKKKKDKKPKQLISNYMRDDWRDFVDTEDEDTKEILYANNYGSGYISAEAAEEAKLYTVLNKAGWDSYKIMRTKSGHSKKNLDKMKKEEKARRKAAKKAKKKRKEFDEHIDSVIVGMMEDNGYSDFGDFFDEYSSDYLAY